MLVVFLNIFSFKIILNLVISFLVQINPGLPFLSSFDQIMCSNSCLFNSVLETLSVLFLKIPIKTNFPFCKQYYTLKKFCKMVNLLTIQFILHHTRLGMFKHPYIFFKSGAENLVQWFFTIFKGINYPIFFFDQKNLK